MSGVEINGTYLSNPYTPAAFLPPELAYQEQISKYVLVGSAGAIVWDILSNLIGDYKLLFKHKIGIPTVVYFISRIAALFYVSICTIFETAPLGNCSAYQIVNNVSLSFAAPTTALQFFLRVRAIFTGNKYIIFFFLFLWLSVLGCCLSTITGMQGVTIGPTQYCTNPEPKLYIVSPAIAMVVHDTLVFLAISWHLNSHSDADPGTRNRWKSFFSGHYLPRFTRALLRDGQVYYLITVICNLVIVIVIFITSIPGAYRAMLSVPNVVLTNAMACRVFRSTRSLGSVGVSRTSVQPNTLPLAFRQTTVRSGVGDSVDNSELFVVDTEEMTK
ncbi:hypothetical protein SERLA73DRAFT_109086 [Serpula lacrymans var. lacrymans S7.3]|uniref:Integral membrane protein n=2 Tax=Serpula lacrymans var. lacrymans TaxID=341189 RepID=F8Q0L2_SERL3|nr:uncharacterized protein SERLADRAFT_438738 [Serpula lacrymans var. lacrymans S7.9]EGN97841.1 hypothetical protein SERLA73DRAFT_109086 [Serpula lacrymans var. lacrymans S7.3]EGO23428.1 hypothetical protein SERLADRAFT_438738 [Serpula lacrymans var. lacrymans S7.9]